tara:strand:+ start:1233 stop:1619 length:387 start_codon:yes stop_codon:yes gene_type:complete
MTDNIEFSSIGPNHEQITLCEISNLKFHSGVKSTFLKSYGVLVCGGCVFPGHTWEREFDGLGFYSGPYWVRATDYHNGTTSPTTEKAINAFLFQTKPSDFECEKVDSESIEGHFLWDIRNGGGPYVNK